MIISIYTYRYCHKNGLEKRLNVGFALGKLGQLERPPSEVRDSRVVSAEKNIKVGAAAAQSLVHNGVE